MAKTIISIIIFLVVIGVIYTIFLRETQPSLFSTYKTKTIHVGTATLEVFIADTNEKRIQGLMNIPRLEGNTGMVFTFPTATPRTFWNKNTLINLDLIWIANNRIIGISALPSITQSTDSIRVSSPGAVDTVIEVNAGWVHKNGIKIGDSIK
jgi:uncharacterized protein